MAFRFLALCSFVVVAGCVAGCARAPASLGCRDDDDCPAGACGAGVCGDAVPVPVGGEGEGEEGEGEEGEGDEGEGEEGEGEEGEGEGEEGEGEGEGEGKVVATAALAVPDVVEQNDSFELSWTSTGAPSCALTVDGLTATVAPAGTQTVDALLADVDVAIDCAGATDELVVTPRPPVAIASAWPAALRGGAEARQFRFDLRVTSGQLDPAQQTLVHAIDLDAVVAAAGVDVAIDRESVIVFDGATELVTFVVAGVDGVPRVCFESTALAENADKVLALYADARDFPLPAEWARQPAGDFAEPSALGPMTVADDLNITTSVLGGDLASFGWRLQTSTGVAGSRVDANQQTASFAANAGALTPTLGPVVVIESQVSTAEIGSVQQVVTTHASTSSVRAHVTAVPAGAAARLALFVDIDGGRERSDDAIRVEAGGFSHLNGTSDIGSGVSMLAVPAPRLVFVDNFTFALAAWDRGDFDHGNDPDPDRDTNVDGAAVLVWDVPPGGLAIDLVFDDVTFGSTPEVDDGFDAARAKVRAVAEVVVVDGAVWRFVP